MSARSRHIGWRLQVAVARAWWRARLGFAPRDERHRLLAQELRSAFEDLGPAFVKLGQIVSVRPDVFGPEFVFEMELLQDSVAPVPYEAIRDVITADLGSPPEELFAEFDPEPVASASIAQVHRAVLRAPYRPVHGDELRAGTPLAVKVVRPRAAETIVADLEVARAWVRRAARLEAIGRFNPEELLEEFGETLERELDLRNEGRVADRYRFDFRDDDLMVVPRVVWPLSTRRVLTMEYVEGWRLSELDEAARAGIDGHALAVHGADVFMRQVLVLGRFHADLHPANIFVTPEGRICYLDFGIMGATTPEQRIAIAQVLAATVYRDAGRAIRYSAELGLAIPADREAELIADVATLMSRTMPDGGRADIRAYATGFLQLLARHGVAVPVGYGLLVKALVTVEGVARALYPDIDIAQAARPFATRLIAEEMVRPERIAERMPAAVRAALRELAE